MTGQISIWEWLGTDDINSMDEEEMVRRVGDATGLDFKYRDNLFGWEHKSKGVRFNIHYSNYHPGINDGRRFISCGFDYGNGGRSGPMDSLEEAITFFKKCTGG